MTKEDKENIREELLEEVRNNIRSLQRTISSELPPIETIRREAFDKLSEINYLVSKANYKELWVINIEIDNFVRQIRETIYYKGK